MEPTYRRSAPFAAARRLLNPSPPIMRRLVGDPIEVDGRVLNRSVQLLLEVARRSGQDALGGATVAQRRAALARTTRLGMPIATNLHVTDRYLPGHEGLLPVRVYRPYDLEPTPPAILFLHGGGWVVGDLETHDGSCRLLALHSGCVVVAVDYRLAPEFPFPAPVDDAIASYRSVVARAEDLAIDGDNVAVMGDSAGGNLAAVVAQTTRNLDVPTPVAHGLVYPGLDFRMATASHELFSDGFFLTRESMDWYRDQYLGADHDITDPLASPGLNADLDGVAPAWIWTAGFDPLRDEARAYADALAKAGVETHHRCYDDQIHGFFGMGVLPGGLDIVAEMSRQMGELIRAHRR